MPITMRERDTKQLEVLAQSDNRKVATEAQAELDRRKSEEKPAKKPAAKKTTRKSTGKKPAAKKVEPVEVEEVVEDAGMTDEASGSDDTGE